MHKDLLTRVLGLEPFEVLSTRQTVKGLQSLLECYDTGEYNLEQFRSFLERNKEFSYNINTILTALAYLIDHRNIKTVVICKFAGSGVEEAKVFESYLDILIQKGFYPSNHAVVTANIEKTYGTKVDSICPGLHIYPQEEDLVVVFDETIEYLKLRDNQPQAVPNYPTVRLKRLMNIEEAFALKEQEDKLLRETHKG